MRFVVHRLGGEDWCIPWRRCVVGILIGHALVLIGWPVVSFLVTGDWLHRWPLGLLTALGGAFVALSWGYFRSMTDDELAAPLSKRDLRQLLVSLDAVHEPAADHAVTSLLRLAAALNEWDYPCVARIECGYSVQDANYVGDIEVLLGNACGTWRATVRPSCFGNLITIIDPENVVDVKREREMWAIFQQFGYTYLPNRLLAERYPGADYDTWFDRFFSWG
jgi:hypothetical protein